MNTESPDKVSAQADVSDHVMRILCKYLSPTTATSTLVSARRRGASTQSRFDHAQLREALPQIGRSLRLFLADPKRVDECLRALEACASKPGAATGPQRVTVQIRVEDDVVKARNQARELALSLGFSLTGRTRLATAVSELARNIVLYAESGEIELGPRYAPNGLEVIARDRGPGIPNLDDIMNGNYKSKLGLGMGLRGVKQIADQFSIDTTPSEGTTVTFLLWSK